MMKYIVLLVAFSLVQGISTRTRRSPDDVNPACFANNHTHSISIKTGSSFYHECHCANPDTPVELTWINPHGEEVGPLGLGTESKVFVERQGRSASLLIPRISKTISGLYKCLATVDGKINSSVFVIEAYDPLYFVATNQSQYVIKGKDSLVHCNARGESAPFITWYKELNNRDSTRLLNDDKYQIEPNGLLIRNVDEDDAGTYKCRANVFETAEAAEKNIEVEVLRLPVIIGLEVTPNKTVTIGDSLSIECIATGLPHPQYYWNKTTDTVLIETWKREDVNKITFNEVKPSDRGNYQCKAFNKAGTTTKEVFIEVLEPAVIEEFSNVTTAEGATAQIICKAYGRPAPTLTLYGKEGADRDPSIIWDIKHVSEVESMFILTFTPVKRSHGGIYTCNADNEVGSTNESAQLEVLYKPYFHKEREIVWAWSGKTVNLSCAHDSNPTSNVTWRFLGINLPTSEQVAINRQIIPEDKQDLEYLTIDAADDASIYGEYECQATNELGQANKTVVLLQGFPPSAISDLSIKELTASSVTFEIKEPVLTKPVLPVIGFTAEYDEERNYEITTIHKNRTWSIDRPYLVDKLKPNTSYLIKFAAINEVGTGAWGGYVPFSTMERTIPETPVWEENAMLIHKQNLVIKWKAAEDHDVVDYYVVKYCPVYIDVVNHHLCKEDVVKSVTALNLEHLNHNTTYLLELVAHNAKGNSSSAERYVTIPASREVPAPTMSAAMMIAVSIIVVILCIVALDSVLFFWRRQGLIATCYYKKNKKAKEDDTLSRDKKGLLRNSSNPSTADDTLKRDRGHKEFEYNKTTGVITGKHSAV